MNKTKSPSTAGRTRNWAFVMYPDSAPDNWRETIAMMHISALVSPLHDEDINADEEQKKAHWHVVIMFDGPASETKAQKISDKVHGTKVQRVASLRSYARYLCHLDNPEKASYEIDGVTVFGGVNYLDLISSAADVDSAITDMEQWCDDNNVYSYAELCRYARKNKPEWCRILRHKCTVHMKAYLQSCQWEQEHLLREADIHHNKW